MQSLCIEKKDWPDKKPESCRLNKEYPRKIILEENHSITTDSLHCRDRV